MNVAQLRQRAAAALESGDLSQAIEQLQSAVRIQPDSAESRHELAECHWRAYEFDRALAGYEEAFRVASARVETCSLAARKLFGLGRFRDSALWMSRAVELSPGDANLLTMLGEVQERSHRWDEAEDCANRALALSRRHARAVRLRALIQERRGRYEKAREILQSQLAESPGPEDWRLRHELAVVLDRLGEYPSAMGELMAAKEQLRSLATPLVDRARVVRERQAGIARLLQRADFEAWKAAATGLSPAVPIVFLCGHPRSGTTLLERILAAHPGVITTDETGVLTREFIDPMMWQAGTAEAAVGELGGFDTDQIRQGREAYLRFTGAHLGEAVGARVLVEKDPALTPDLPLPLRLFPEGRVVFPLRDPRDVCLSYFFTLIPLAVSSAAALDLASTVESCSHSLDLWAHWKRTLPHPCLETRYETLVTRPEPESRRLVEFLGLPWNPEVLTFHERSSERGIRTPTYADAAGPVYSRAVSRWRNYEKYLAPHLGRLRPHLQAFGYD